MFQRNFAGSCLFVLTLLWSSTLLAESADSNKTKLKYPNNIKVNISSSILYSPSFQVAYERVVKPSQSFTVIAGYVTFPQIIRSLPDSFVLEETKSRTGFRVGADYRFYFKKESHFQAPHGLYWSPFADYFYLHNNRVITPTDSSMATGVMEYDAKLQLIQTGVALGYQFSLIKDRMTIDLCMFGPAVAYYKANISLKGDYDIDIEDEYLQDIYDYLINSFPALGQLVSEKDKELTSEGFADFFYLGFRYSIWVGFRF